MHDFSCVRVCVVRMCVCVWCSGQRAILQRFPLIAVVLLLERPTNSDLKGEPVKPSLSTVTGALLLTTLFKIPEYNFFFFFLLETISALLEGSRW